jgi:WD40 repeat protein
MPGGNAGAGTAQPNANSADSTPAGKVGSSAPIKNLADPNAPAPELWKIKPDPAETQPPAITQDVLLRVPPSFFGGEVTYPTAPSVFVAVGRNGDQNDVREIWDLAGRKRFGALRGNAKLDKPFALSPDGALFAGKADRSFVVFETKTGRLVAQLAVASPFADYVDFAGPGQLVTGTSGDRRFEIWDLKSQKSELDVSPRDRVARESIALSPGRRYLAMIGASTLWVYDLQSGRKAGEAQVPKNGTFDLSCKGLAFSPDGTELAGLFDSFGLHLLCWDTATGRLTHQFKYDDKSGLKMPLGFEGIAIDWLADKAGWLVFGTVVIDHQSGQKTFTIPSDAPNAEKGPRRIVGKNLVLITVGDAQHRVVRSFALPTETIASAAKLIQEGGSADDAALPPLMQADLSGARRVAVSGAAPAWSIRPDCPGPQASPSRRSIPVQVAANEAIGLLFSGPEAHQVALVSIPGGTNPFDPNQNDGKPRRLFRFDSQTGRALGRAELTALGDPVALSPDGARVLVLDNRDHRRLDVYGSSDAAHVAGWRPYVQELSDDNKAVIWADFLATDRVLTANRGGQIVLWELPACKAVYVAEAACEGAPLLSPGRKYLAAYQAGTFRFLDPATGALKGEARAPASTSSGSRGELRGAAFQADGSGLAALVGGRQIVRWDIASGRVTADFPVPMTINPGNASHHAVIESCGPNHVLLDGRILVDLEKQSHIWSYFGPNVSTDGPDGRHWYVSGGLNQNAAITPLALPEDNVHRVVAMVNDPAVRPSLRVGMQVAVQLELGGPPRDGQKFRQELTDSLNAKLRANGMGPGQGGQVSIIVHVDEKDTGKSVDYREFGDSHFSTPRGSISLKNLVCEVQFADSKGRIPLAPQQTIGMLQGFRRMYRLPPGETLESYLKNSQWAGVKMFVGGIGLPYFVARQPEGIVMLPGTTDLNATR